MKIGIDIQASRGQVTGLGVYTKHLAEALLKEKRNGWEFLLFKKESSGNLNTAQRLFWENVALPRLAKNQGVEILHTAAFAPPFFKPCKGVATVHDLIGMIFPNALGGPSRFYWGKWLPLTLRKADALIADSENTKKDIVSLLKIPEERVKVIYPSGHEGFAPCSDSEVLRSLRDRFGIKEKYFLCVGTLEPRKNLVRILEAFAKFKESGKSATAYQLVVVGSKDFAHGRFFRLIQEKCPALAEKNILFTGYIEQKNLNLLYSGAEAFLFPSLYEGFGIPVLEAMASGTPVLTSSTSSLPEVAGEAGFYVDPRDTEAIAEGIRTLAGQPGLREELIRKGFERIRRFSWSQTALETLKVYEALS